MKSFVNREVIALRLIKLERIFSSTFLSGSFSANIKVNCILEKQCFLLFQFYRLKFSSI